MTHAPGTFCFAELVSPDVASAKQFYGDLFGWTTDAVTSSSGPYFLFQIDGQVVGGLRAITRGRQRWIPYLAVERLEPTVAHAERLGARLGDEPFEVSGVARMATTWIRQVASSGSGKPVAAAAWIARNRPARCGGSRCWRTTSPARRTSTALSLAGRRTRGRLPHLSHGYTVYSVGSESVAGAIKIQRDWGRVPERWQVLFAVTDLDRIIDQTHDLGGSDDLPVIDIPNIGRCASLLDDRQCVFFTMQPEGSG